MKLYTTAELSREFGLSRQRLYAMRRDGILKQGEHWTWVEGTVMHTEAARELLKERRKRRERNS